MLRRPLRPARLLGLATLTTALACGDPYTHTNPYDPAVSVAITISGPDTLFSSFEQGVYSAQSTPAFSDTAWRWSSNMSGPVGNTATFLSVAPPAWPATDVRTISVMVGAIDTVPVVALAGPVVPIQFYRHTAMRTVVVTQRFTHVRLRCPDVHACDTLSVGGTWTVWADALDALNQGPYRGPGSPPPQADGPSEASFLVRDPTVASATTGTRASTVTALKSGSTWIVAIRASLLDSLQLVVR
jgi:hypothetical protein